MSLIPAGGISVEQQEAIFDRFVKLDSFAQGTGLGLFYLPDDCRSSRGERWALSLRSGKGSTFLVYLPLQSAGETCEGGCHF